MQKKLEYFLKPYVRGFDREVVSMSFTNEDKGEWGTIANFILLEKKKDFKSLIRCLSPTKESKQTDGRQRQDLVRALQAHERGYELIIHGADGSRNSNLNEKSRKCIDRTIA